MNLHAIAMERFVIGMKVYTSDGPCGELRRLIVNPISREVTYLVVAARHHRASHLVPVALVASVDHIVTIRCSKEDLALLPDAESRKVELRANYAGVGKGGTGSSPRTTSAVRDRFPLGDVDVVRGDRVLATDGPVGRVRGFVTNPADDHLRYVLIDEGHPRGRKGVAIPANALETFDNGLRLTISKAEVRDLESVGEA